MTYRRIISSATTLLYYINYSFHANDGSKMSMNTIQAIVHTGTTDDVKLKQVTKAGS